MALLHGNKWLHLTLFQSYMAWQSCAMVGGRHDVGASEIVLAAG